MLGHQVAEGNGVVTDVDCIQHANSIVSIVEVDVGQEVRLCLQSQGKTLYLNLQAQ